MDTSKYKALYLQESAEHIAGIEKGLLSLEKDVSDAAIIDNLFRHYHSIKGMSASMGYEPIQKLAHAQEDLLDRIRQKQITASAAITSALFQALDGLKSLLKRVEDGAPLDINIEPLVAMIKDSIENRTPQAPEARQTPPVAASPAAAPVPTESELKLPHVMKVEGRIFDELLATVGDLVMALSTFKSASHGSSSIEMKDGVYRLGKYINVLHHGILAARMLPIEDLTEGLPRIIRDMSLKSGKEIELRIEGSDLRLDRAMLEGLGSPLVHIIRNSVDHGIESVAERLRIGKPRSGVITIMAFRKKDRIIITVADDGKGIDVLKIREKARLRGIPPEKLDAMTDKEAIMLVCLPGLSSADVVTETSGRGVGMDVVKGTVEALGGSIVISSTPGVGARIDMELPITTSIIKALLVSVGQELFLMPLSRIERVLEVHKREIADGWFSYDGTRIPIVPLGKAIGMAEEEEQEYYTLIVAYVHTNAGIVKDENNAMIAGIRVSAFHDEIDAYIRPLQPPITRLWGVSGITVMGDGRTVFLLDLSQILSKTTMTAC